MSGYSVVIDDLLEGDMTAEQEPDVGDWATIRYYNDLGDVHYAEGVITAILEEFL